MDTSNSTKINLDLHDFLFYGGRAKASELTPEAWAKVINSFVDRIMPILQYLDGIKTIEQIIADGQWGHTRNRKVRITGITMDFTLRKNTRAFFIRTIASKPATEQLGVSLYTFLLLTEKGNWVEWEARECADKCVSHLTFLRDTKTLCQFLKEYGFSGYAIMDKFYLLLNHSARVKEDRLKNIQRLEALAQSVTNRVDLNL